MLNHDRKVRKSYPYLTTARFPHNWAVADMVKGYLAGTRKEHNRQSREEVEKKRYVWLINFFFALPLFKDNSGTQTQKKDSDRHSSSQKSKKRSRSSDDEDNPLVSKKEIFPPTRPKPNKRSRTSCDVDRDDEGCTRRKQTKTTKNEFDTNASGEDEDDEYEELGPDAEDDWKSRIST